MVNESENPAAELVYEHVYDDYESAGVAVLVACAMLSAMSVLGMFVLLGVSALRTSTSDKTPFVRTHLAMCFFSLLLCNLFQAIGGIMSITWVIEHRVFAGVICTAQAAIKQLGNVGAAMFSFVIAIHTFSLLFLRRQWSDRTCYIILIVSWASLVLEMSIENFVLAKPKTKGPYYGVAGYWCWITAAYSTERYATSYLFIFISAVVSFILYLLVFFRLRGNISVSAGFKLDFHRRPKVRFGRTSNGTYVLTDDRRVESHFTRVAKHMLWYPLVYAILVVPQATARFCSFAGQPVPFPVTIVTTAVFLLHGFVNTMLFCTTRNILPGNWRQRLGLSTSRETQGDIDLSTRTNATWHFTGVTARPGTTVGPGGVVEKVVEIKVEETYPVPAYPKFGFHPSPTTPTTPTTPTPLLQADGDSERRKRQNRKISIFATHDVRTSIYAEEDGDDGDSDFDAGIDSTITTRTMDPRDSPQASEYALEGYESGPSITSSLQVPPPVHLVSTTRPPVDDDKRQSHSSSISTFDSIVTPAHFPRAGSPATPMSGWASEEL